MDEEPNSRVSKQKPLDSSAKLFSQVNLHVKIAMSAIRTKNNKALHYAFLNIGMALGIDKAIIDIVKSYTKHVHVPQEFGRERRDLKNTRLIFHKDWNHLEAMLADIPLEKKIDHAREFMRSRQIPPGVVNTLHVPICMIKYDDSLNEEVRVDSACQTAEKSTDQKISFKWLKMSNSIKSSRTWDNKGDKDSETRDRAREYESKTRSSKFSPCDSKRSDTADDEQIKVPSQDSENKKLSHDKVEKTARKDSETRTHSSEDESKTHRIKRSPSDSKSSDSKNDARSKVSSQDGKSSVRQKGSERPTAGSENKKLSREKSEKIERNNSDSRKRSRDDQSEPRSNKRSVSDFKCSDSTTSAQNKVSSRDEKRSAREVDDKKSSRKSNDKIVHRGSSDDCKRARGDKSETRSANRPESHSKRSDSKDSVQKREAKKSSASKTDAVDAKKSSRDSDVPSPGDKTDSGVSEMKRSSPDCKENTENCRSSDCHGTKLVIQNLHPLVSDVDISMIFSEFKSYKSCKVNLYDSSKLLCAADVVFDEVTDAVEAKKRFDGKKLDGFPMHIALVKSEKD